MKLGHLKGNIIEKNVYDKDGSLLRVTFCIYEREGRFKAQILKIEKVNQIEGFGNYILAGPFIGQSLAPEFKQTGINSPFFSIDSLTFLGSKPRAPTY